MGVNTGWTFCESCDEIIPVRRLQYYYRGMWLDSGMWVVVGHKHGEGAMVTEDLMEETKKDARKRWSNETT